MFPPDVDLRLCVIAVGLEIARLTLLRLTQLDHCEQRRRMEWTSIYARGTVLLLPPEKE